MNKVITATLKEAETSLCALQKDDSAIKAIADAAVIMVSCLRSRKKIIAAGNGGSTTQSAHFCQELSGRYRKDRQALAALSISEPGHITCVGNDYGFPFIFSRFLEAHGNEGDVFLGLSTSGKSDNIINAATRAQALGMKVVTLTGHPNTVLEQFSDVTIVTPAGVFADRIQELHSIVIHILIELIEQQLCS